MPRSSRPKENKIADKFGGTWPLSKYTGKIFDVTLGNPIVLPLEGVEGNRFEGRGEPILPQGGNPSDVYWRAYGFLVSLYHTTSHKALIWEINNDFNKHLRPPLVEKRISEFMYLRDKVYPNGG